MPSCSKKWAASDHKLMQIYSIAYRDWMKVNSKI